MLNQFMKTGAKVYYIGMYSGLYGWFLTKDNEIQFVYTIPGSPSALIGILFDGNGNDVTSQQIKKLYDTNKEVNTFFTNLQNAQSLPQAMQTPLLQQASPVPMANAATPSGGMLMPPVPSSTSPGEQLMQNLQSAAGVDVGAATAPKLYMVIDPNCPHCHETWQAMRAAVFGGKLQIRLVPLGVFGPDSIRAAGQLLHASNPLDAWDKYVGGDKTQLAGDPDTATLTNIRDNHMLADLWHIQMTPYLVYRAKDGQVKIVQGEPDHPDKVISDVGP
jgi:thiol:disulfide interchange protein DsbG